MAFNKTVTNVNDSVLSHFTTAWNNLTPITYDNIDHQINYTGDWIRISNRITNVDVSALGQVNFRPTGVIFMQLFTVAGNSTSNNNVYLDRLFDSMSQVQIEDYITLRQIEINGYSQGQDTNGVYYQTNLSTQFYYDVYRT
jgi:hypothetical protein